MTVGVEYQNRSETNNNNSEQNHLKLIQKLTEQHNWKSWNQDNTKNIRTDTADIIPQVGKETNKKVIHGNNITCTIHCKGTITSKLYTLETRFFFQTYNCEYSVQSIHNLYKGDK